MKFLCVFEMSDGVQPIDVTTAVVQSGFDLVSQQQEGHTQTIVARAPGEPTQDEIIGELRKVQGCTLVRLAFSKTEAEAEAPKKEKKTLRRLGRKKTILDITDEASALAIIGKSYPRIAPAVKAYSDTLNDANRSASLMEIGRKVGAGVYQRDYSLGSPLKLYPMVSRELRPALKDFSATDVDDLEVRLAKNPFCDMSGQTCCDFVVGFMFGFLSSNPTVNFEAVEEVICGAGSDSACTFHVIE